MDEAALPKNPNQELAQWLFEATNPDCGKDAAEARKKIFAEIESKNMGPFYQKVCEVLKEPVDEQLLARYKAANAEELARLEKKITDALSENEVREATLAKAEYLCTIGDNAQVDSAFRAAFDKTVALGQRMDIVFYQIRIGLFNGDNASILRNLEKAEDLLKQGGDWDRRNRLKVYRGLYCVVARDFKAAALLFLETVSTFTSIELMEYKDFVAVTVLLAICTLSRPELKKKVVDGPEIQEVLFEQPLIKQYLNSFYNCSYATFFQSLAEVEKLLKANRYFAPHYRFYVREMRILAYKQILESYRSLTLEHMSKEFGVSVGFIDKELSRFVAAGRLNCKIDSVGGIVETNRPDKKNAQYQSAIKQGDLLLNRIQKLSQVINI